MKKYLMIENDGELDPMAFLLIGASTKADDPSKIGEFGSGANYAIAWLLRNEYSFKIFSGTKSVEFTKAKTIMRDRQFEKILVDGTETSFTTSMGKGWKAWFILREFWSNALDETGAAMTEITTDVDRMNIPVPGSSLNGKEGKTRIFIELRDEMAEAYDNWHLYFCTLRTDLLGEANGMRVYAGGDDLVVYRKGIQVYFKKGVKSAFHYDLDSININESRVIESEWDLNYKLAQMWSTAPTELCREFIKRVDDKTYESRIDWTYANTPGVNWKEAIGDNTVIGFTEVDDFKDLVEMNNPVKLPGMLANRLIRANQADSLLDDISQRGILKAKANEQEQRIMNSALESLEQCGYEVKYEVRFASFRVKGTAARAHKEKIYLGSLACSSVFYCASTIVEEQEHLETQFGDETRQFQQHLIDKYVALLFKSNNLQVQQSKNDHQ